MNQVFGIQMVTVFLYFQAIRNLPSELVLAVQRKTLFSQPEKDLLSTVKSNKVKGGSEYQTIFKWLNLVPPSNGPQKIEIPDFHIAILPPVLKACPFESMRPQAEELQQVQA